MLVHRVSCAASTKKPRSLWERGLSCLPSLASLDGRRRRRSRYLGGNKHHKNKHETKRPHARLGGDGNGLGCGRARVHENRFLFLLRCTVTGLGCDCNPQKEKIVRVMRRVA